MRDRLVELIIKTPRLPIIINGRKQGKTYQTVGNIADHLLANSVVALHCKVGDVVYQTDGVNIYENEVCEISLSKRAVIYYTENAVAFDETALGKSIFLTKEEAERALKN